MSIVLILFFLSLLGIVVMIGKKLIVLKNKQFVIEKEFLVQYPDLRDIRYIAIKKTREYGYIILVEIIRFSIRSSRVLKRKYKEAGNKIKNITRKHIINKEETREKEASIFLKMISEYKHKIRKIKKQIREEESEAK
jgi:hypothetical protein